MYELTMWSSAKDIRSEGIRVTGFSSRQDALRWVEQAKAKLWLIREIKE